MAEGAEIGSLHVIFPGNERGGAATHIAAFAEGIVRAKLLANFHFVSVGDGPLLTTMVRLVGPGNVVELPAQPSRALRGLIALMRQAGPHSLWHANGPRLNVMTYLAAVMTRRRWTTTIHSDVRKDFLGSSWKSLVFTRIHSLCLRHVVGGFVGNLQFGQFLSGKSAYFVPNAVDANPLPSPKSVYQRQLKASLNLSDSDFLVGIAARFDPVKDIPTILRAISLLKQPHIHLVLAGDGPQKPELVQLVNTLGIESNVHFVGFLDNIHPYYAGLDAHVLASRSEGASPFAILEAGCCDTVNIGSDIPGIRNLIQPNVTGLCFPVGDAEWLAEQIQAALVDEELRQSLAFAFRSTVLPNYTTDAMLQAYLYGYKEMGNAVRHVEHA
jgi:L-malate glycosyltransferase